MDTNKIAELAAAFVPVRKIKVYTLAEGTIPAKPDKANRFQKHTVVIACAITSLVQEGTTSATRDAIMEKAVSLGLYDPKVGQPSKSSPSYIFSWHQPALRLAGFLA